MSDPKVIELEAKIAKLADVINDPTPLYKEYIYKDDERTIKPNLKVKHVDELNDAIIRRAKDLEEFKASIEKDSVEIPSETLISVENSINLKDTFINKGTVNWDSSSGFVDPYFFIESNTLYFRFKNEDLIDYVEINGISPDGKEIIPTQGGSVGDGIYIKVPVLVDYLGKDSVGTKYTVAVVTGQGRNQKKGFFTYVYKK